MFSIFQNFINFKLPKLLTFSKISKVQKRIKEIQSELGKHGPDIANEDLMDLLSEQVALEQIKKAISLQLGRIIIH